jgi:hypothetical protein
VVEHDVVADEDDDGRGSSRAHRDVAHAGAGLAAGFSGGLRCCGCGSLWC